MKEGAGPVKRPTQDLNEDDCSGSEAVVAVGGISPPKFESRPPLNAALALVSYAPGPGAVLVVLPKVFIFRSVRDPKHCNLSALRSVALLKLDGGIYVFGAGAEDVGAEGNRLTPEANTLIGLRVIYVTRCSDRVISYCPGPGTPTPPLPPPVVEVEAATDALSRPGLVHVARRACPLPKSTVIAER